jgi:hypothetical protein
MIKTFLIVLFSFLLKLGFSQDILILTNGDSLIVKGFTKTGNGKYVFDVVKRNGKLKTLEFYPAELFSLKKDNGEEIIFFEELGNEYQGLDLSVENVRLYIQGEAFAKKNYKFLIGKIVNFLIGASAPFVSTYIVGSIIFSPLLPLLSSTIIGYTGPSGKVYDKKYGLINSNKYFKEGFLVAGRVIRINKGVKSGFAGFVTGMVAYVIAIKFL